MTRERASPAQPDPNETAAFTGPREMPCFRSGGPNSIITVREEAIPRNVRKPANIWKESGTAEIWFWAFCIFMLTSPFTFILIGADPTVSLERDPTTLRRTTEGTQWTVYAIRAGIMTIAIASCASRLEIAVSYLPRLKSLFAFVLWATLSLLWTDMFPATINSMAQIWPLIIVGICLTTILSLENFERIFLYSGALMAASSVIFSIFFPSYGVHQFSDVSQSVHAGAWRGVYMHKNHLGHAAAIYAAGLLFASRTVIGSKIFKFTLFSAMIFLIIMSGSASPFVIMAASPFVVLITVLLNPTIRVISLAYLGLCSIIILSFWNNILEMLGRDPTLTGRTRIWEIAFESIMEQPIWGYGYMSPTYGGFVFQVKTAMGITDPHNGYLDITLALGLIGLSLFLWSTISLWRSARALQAARQAQPRSGLVVSAIVAAWMIGSFSESVFRPLTAPATLGFLALCAMGYGTRSQANTPDA